MSASSQAAGAAPEPGSRNRRRKAAAAAPLEVSLEHARWRHAGWAAFGLVLGGLLIWHLGLVGKGVGVVVVLLSLLAVRAFVHTLMHPPGHIRVGASDLSLPHGVCRAHPVELPVAKLRHAFFLRRAVPWTRTGPLLVVETDEGSFVYPRDWFRSDSDQHRVAAALNHRLGRLEA